MTGVAISWRAPEETQGPLRPVVSSRSLPSVCGMALGRCRQRRCGRLDSMTPSRPAQPGWNPQYRVSRTHRLRPSNCEGHTSPIRAKCVLDLPSIRASKHWTGTTMVHTDDDETRETCEGCEEMRVLIALEREIQRWPKNGINPKVAQDSRSKKQTRA